jgi:hypothetical protein
MMQKASNFKDFACVMSILLLIISIPGVLHAQLDISSEDQSVQPLRNSLFHHRNQFPLIMPVGFVAQSPMELQRNSKLGFSLQQNYTAIHFFKDSMERKIGLDMEYMRYELQLGYRLNSEWQLQLSYGRTWHWDGFMDPFLTWYHEMFNLPNYGRETRDPNDYYFLVEGQSNGDQISINQRKWYSSDPVFSVFSHLITEENMRLSLGMNAQIPLWKGHHGMSNRALNLAFSGYFTYRTGALDLFQNVRFIMPGGSDHFLWKEAKSGFEGNTAFSYSLSKNRHLLAQFNYGQSPFRGTDGNRLDDPPIEFIFGYRYSGKYGLYTLGFSEDFLLPAPDFTIIIGYELPLK